MLKDLNGMQETICGKRCSARSPITNDFMVIVMSLQSGQRIRNWAVGSIFRGNSEKETCCLCENQTAKCDWISLLWETKIE